MSQGYFLNGSFLGRSGSAGWAAGWQPMPGHFASWQPVPGHAAGWQPVPGHAAGWQPVPGHFAGWQPVPGHRLPPGHSDPYGDHLSSAGPRAVGSEQAHRGAGAINTATASPFPWRGIDPVWTYSDPTSLIAQALRKTRTRLMGERDVRLPKANMGRVETPTRTDLALWRWGSEFRQQAVVSDLLGCTVVRGHSVYAAVHSVRGKSGSSRLHRVFEVKAPLANSGFDYSVQIDKVLRAAVEREERLPEILTQASDFRAFFYCQCGLDSTPSPRVDELILVAWAWASHVVMALKNNVAEFRPVQRSSLVIPVISTPQHGSMPSGHATIAAMTAQLLSILLYRKSEPRAAILRRLASRIAFNRVAAGVHFPMDSHVGRYLGTQLAIWFWGMGQEEKPLPQEVKLEVLPDSQWIENDTDPALLNGPSQIAAPAVDSLRRLWVSAEKELHENHFL
jgi:hypothetical protein